MKNNKEILLAFFGDDFTGSTDALEFMSRAGAKTVLFIEPPSKEQLAHYPDLDAVGVAGLTRSMCAAAMQEVLQPAFEKLASLRPRHVHYKVCSTFDSSPSIGSIGKAIDTGAAVFKNKFVPLLVAAPVLGRYCLFGNLFARMGIGSKGEIFRLDRHPSMSKHPVTPADESDLRLHLSRQTTKQIALLDILQLSKTKEEIAGTTRQLMQQGAEIILADALYQEQLLVLGEWIDTQANTQTLFSAGSSGIEMALGQYWNKTGKLQPVHEWPEMQSSHPLLVVSGSCSLVTQSQITYAVTKGFEEITIDMNTVCVDEATVTEKTKTAALEVMQSGKSVIIHTTAQKMDTPVSSKKTGTILGTIAREIAAITSFNRLVVAGGDTSSYAARAMGIESVEMIAALVPGAPLCKATAPGSPLHGKEINFKGGQVGGEDYFEILRNGDGK